MSYEYIVLFIFVLLVCILVYLIINKSKREGFADTSFSSDFVLPTSQSLYSKYNSKDFDAQMYTYKDTIGDINDMLMMYGCGINLGIAPNALEKLVSSAVPNLYYVPLNVSSTYDFQNVQIKIIDIIQNFFDTNNGMAIEGQVYVVIAQSPYYRDSNNNVITLQYNINSYLNLPTDVMNSQLSSQDDLIQFYGYVIFTAYDKNKKLIMDMDVRKQAILKIKQSFRQKEKLCSIICPKKENLLCGCASQVSPSVTNCVDSDVNSKMTPGEKYTYAILYRVNPRFTDFMGREILKADYSDMLWSPDTINAIPRVQPIVPPVSSSPPPMNWKGYSIRNDYKCGKISGKDVGCGGRQCCSKYGWCGGSSGTASDWCHDSKHGTLNGIYDAVQPGT